MRSWRDRTWIFRSRPAKSSTTTRRDCSPTATAGSVKSQRIWNWTHRTARPLMFAAIAFYVFSAVMIGSALMVISARNPVHSVLFLILAFFNAAALFVLLGAEFLAMILVVVYVGAVAVLFLFVVMMLDINFAELRKGMLKHLPVGGFVGAVLLGELAWLYSSWKIEPT